MQKLFDCPDGFNAEGVCHASAGIWLRYSRTRAGTGGVKAASDLGQPAFFKLLWDDPPDAAGIDRVNLLGKSCSEVNKPGPFTGNNISSDLLSNSGNYRLISFWGKKEAHTVAAITKQKNLQFFDPNFSCWTFETDKELREFVESHINDNYPDLLSKKYRIRGWM